MPDSLYETLHETKSHYDTDFSYNTYPCTIPQDFAVVPLHWHNEMELIYIKEGKGLVNIDLNQYFVGKGDLLIVYPGRIHSITNYDNSVLKYENIIFNINMLLPKEYDRNTFEYFGHINNSDNDMTCIIKPSELHYKEIISCIDEADKVCETFPAGYELKIRSCLYNFFFALNTHYSCAASNEVSDSLSNIKKNKLKLIITYIENNYTHAISIQDIAKECHFSESHFMKFFKQCTGTSFISYLNDYRLLIASRLLTSTDLPVTQIAVECGFDNISYFNRCFKKKYGEAPSKIR